MMDSTAFDLPGIDLRGARMRGFQILDSIKKALAELGSGPWTWSWSRG